MSEKPTRRVHRNWDEAERLRHGRQVQERFSREREDRFRKVQDTIEVMLAQGVTISQNEVARVAGVSVGFINKHLRDVVEKAKQRQQKSAGTLHTVRQLSAEAKELERLKLMNRRLREQLDEQRRANKELLAQVARVVDLEDQVELLRTQNRELLAAVQASQEKVTHLPVRKAHAQVEASLKRTGIKLSSTLRQEVLRHSPEAVQRAIEAFEQYRSEHSVQKPVACLLRALQEEWEPNVAQEATTPEEREFDKRYAEAISANQASENTTEKISGQQNDIERFNPKNRKLKATLLGMESLEAENEQLKKQNQHLMRLLTQAQTEERAKAAADFAASREIDQKHPEFPDVEF